MTEILLAPLSAKITLNVVCSDVASSVPVAEPADAAAIGAAAVTPNLSSRAFTNSESSRTESSSIDLIIFSRLGETETDFLSAFFSSLTSAATSFISSLTSSTFSTAASAFSADTSAFSADSFASSRSSDERGSPLSATFLLTFYLSLCPWKIQCLYQ